MTKQSLPELSSIATTLNLNPENQEHNKIFTSSIQKTPNAQLVLTIANSIIPAVGYASSDEHAKIAESIFVSQKKIRELTPEEEKWVENIEYSNSDGLIDDTNVK